MDDEKTYTLDEAARELERQECAASRHAPAHEDSEVGSDSSEWICKCGTVAWVRRWRP